LKSLENILNGVTILQVWGDLSANVRKITPDSRGVGVGDVFIAVRGPRLDGHDYINDAIAAGAKAIVAELAPDSNLTPELIWIQVASAQQALAQMASNYFDNPGKDMKIVGVTGTNGKTSVVSILYQIFSQLGYKTGLISTIDIQWPDHSHQARLTTPGILELQEIFSNMRTAGCTHVFMEVSSHAIDQGRIDLIPFTGGVFTNITHDHLDYHGTFARYIQAKKTFFDHLPQDSFALVNAEDRHAKVMVQNTRAEVYTFGLKGMADFRGKILENRFEGILMRIGEQTVSCHLSGVFNASNLLAAYSVASLLGVESAEILQALSLVKPPAGRMDWVRDTRGRLGIVDFAHTPDALEKVLQTVTELKLKDASIYLVIGCGGDRDAAKRPLMGDIAARFADVAIFTADNPRSEDPQKIISEMMAGVPVDALNKIQEVSDRRQAIRIAARFAQSGDIILVAGKGHEKYQEINGVKMPFDDKAVLEEALQNISSLV
jgi:UDP-N-acetylmuramoyl-L-alanyl-D-glutamate--2,6-diaminopimelate ligase